MKLLRVIALLVVLVIASGCKPPQVNFKNALLKGLTTSRINIGLGLELINPNDFQIPVKNIDYKLDLFNSPFTNGQTKFSKRVGPKSRTDVEVPLGIRYSAVKLGVTSMLTKRSIPWGIQGGCTFDVAGNPVRIGFGDQGQWRNPLLR